MRTQVYTENEETILRILRRSPKTTRQIADATTFTVPQVSVQLRRMAQKGLVENISSDRKHGLWKSLVAQ